MKEIFNRYGARLSDEEYDKKIIAIYEDAPEAPTKKEQKNQRKKELDLNINHRLGIDFPQEKRDAMWKVAQNIEKERWRIPFLSLKNAFYSAFIKKDLNLEEKDLGAMAGYLVEKYGTVLDEEELEQYFSIKKDGITPSFK